MTDRAQPTMEAIRDEYEYEDREAYTVLEPDSFESLELRVWPDLSAEVVDLGDCDRVVERSDRVTWDELERMLGLVRENALYESRNQDW